MYIQKGDMGGMVQEESLEKETNKPINKWNKSEHDKWKKIRITKPKTNFQKMSYWQVVSHCTIL